MDNIDIDKYIEEKYPNPAEVIGEVDIKESEVRCE